MARYKSLPAKTKDIVSISAAVAFIAGVNIFYDNIVPSSNSQNSNNNLVEGWKHAQKDNMLEGVFSDDSTKKIDLNRDTTLAGAGDTIDFQA